MKKLLRLLSFMLVMSMIAPSIHAGTAEFAQSDFAAASDGYSATVNGVTMTITGSDAGMGYSPMRWYKNAVITIECDNEITGIVFYANTNAYATALANATVDMGTLTADAKVVTWGGNANKIVITNSNAQTRIDSFVVTFTDPVGAVAIPTFNPDGGVVVVESTVAVTADAGNRVYVSSEAQLGTSTPTAEQVVAVGSSTNTFTITAPGTYFAVAVDGQGNKSLVTKATFELVYTAGTEEDPYTVADAIKVANANGSSSDVNVYVEGYVCETPTINNDGSYTFSIVGSENLEGDQLKAYKVTSDKAMDQGDKVVLYGPLCMYGKTPEVNTGEVKSVTGKKDAEIAWSADAYTWNVGISTPAELPNLINPYNVAIEYTSSDTEVATISANGVVTIVGEGNTTITAAVEVNNAYKVSVVSYSLTVVDPTKIEDVLNDGNIPGFKNAYQNYTYTTDNGLTYEIFGYKTNGMQFNNKADASDPKKDYTASGIVVTDNEHGYVVKSIAIQPYSLKANILVIGRNTAYTGTDEIKNATNRESDLGTVIATIESGTADQVVVTPNAEYKYICICPATTGVCQITSVTVNWKEATPAADVTVTIGQYGYTTLYYGEKNLTVPAGVDAYTYRVVGETAVADKTYPAGSVIPAGEAVLLAGAAGEYTFTESATAGEKAAVNCLRGADEDDVIVPAANETLYKLAKGSQGVGFYVAYPDNDPAYLYNAHKAYLAVTTTSAGKAPKYIGLPNNGQSGVVNVIVDGDDDVNAPAYNVMGQKVTNDYKGFVIKNGKKMYNK